MQIGTSVNEWVDLLLYVFKEMREAFFHVLLQVCIGLSKCEAHIFSISEKSSLDWFLEHVPNLLDGIETRRVRRQRNGVEIFIHCMKSVAQTSEWVHRSVIPYEVDVTILCSDFVHLPRD